VDELASCGKCDEPEYVPTECLPSFPTLEGAGGDQPWLGGERLADWEVVLAVECEAGKECDVEGAFVESWRGEAGDTCAAREVG
jgi:hypothetical protein